MIFEIGAMKTQFGTYTTIKDINSNDSFAVINDIARILGYENKEEAIKIVSDENKYKLAIDIPYLGSKIVTVINGYGTEELLYESSIPMAAFIDGLHVEDSEFRAIGRFITKEE